MAKFTTIRVGKPLNLDDLQGKPTPLGHKTRGPAMPLTTDADDQTNRASVLTGREPDGWHPTNVDVGLVALDVIARFCVNFCLPVTEDCTEADCRVWNLERAAVDCLEQRRLAAGR